MRDMAVSVAGNYGICHDCIRRLILVVDRVTDCLTEIKVPGRSIALSGDMYTVVDDQAGIMFGVELYVLWDAPEAVVGVSSAGVAPLRNVPDVIGLVW